MLQFNDTIPPTNKEEIRTSSKMVEGNPILFNFTFGFVGC